MLPCFARTFKGFDQEVCHVQCRHVQQCICGVLDPLLKKERKKKDQLIKSNLLSLVYSLNCVRMQHVYFKFFKLLYPKISQKLEYVEKHVSVQEWDPETK